MALPSQACEMRGELLALAGRNRATLTAVTVEADVTAAHGPKAALNPGRTTAQRRREPCSVTPGGYRLSAPDFTVERHVLRIHIARPFVVAKFARRPVPPESTRAKAISQREGSVKSTFKK